MPASEDWRVSATDCDACRHPLHMHGDDRGTLRCSEVVSRHYRAVDDYEDEECDCMVALGDHDRPLEARWLLARAAHLLEGTYDDGKPILGVPHLSGEAERVRAVAESVVVATEGWTVKAC